VPKFLVSTSAPTCTSPTSIYLPSVFPAVSAFQDGSLLVHLWSFLSVISPIE
jgi:hypothetical protein